MNNVIELITREMPITAEPSGEDRSFRAVIATDTPVLRRDAKGPFLEVLDPTGLTFEPDTDLPLLLDHKATARETVGRANSIEVAETEVSATLHLASIPDVEPLLHRIRERVLRHVSAGYAVQQWRETVDPKTRQRTKTAIRWQLREVSLTPVPADPRAIIHRTEEGATMPFDLQERTALIDTLRSACGLPETWGDDLAEEAISDDDVRTAAREAMAERNPPRIRVNRDHSDPTEIRSRVSDAIAFRMGAAELPDASREFAQMTMLDHAREALTRAGTSTRGMSVDEVLERSMTTSDFPLTVQNAAGKIAADGYQAAESPLKVLFRRRPLSNFKTSTAIRLSGMGQLEELTESGEIKATSRGEEGETLQLRTFARRLDMTRKLVIDDDLNLFGDVTRELGEAAAATEAQLMYDQLTSSGTLSDGVTLFHTDRGNVETDTSQILSLTNARKILRNQTNLDGKTPIRATPRYLVCGPQMETDLEALVAAIQPTEVANVNPFAGKFTLLVEPRITNADWYVFADPNECAVFNLATFSAAPGPQIQRQEKWDTLGVSFRVWLDVGTGFAGWRGAVKLEENS